MKDFSSFEAAQATLDAQIKRANENFRRAQALEESVATLMGRASSPQGEVEVEVDRAGILRGLVLTPEAMGIKASELSRLILSTFQQAHHEVSENYLKKISETFGENSATTAAVAADIRSRVGAKDASASEQADVSSLWQRRES